MKKILIVLGFLLFPHFAEAQSQRNPCYYTTTGLTACQPVGTSTNGVGNGPLPVGGKSTATAPTFVEGQQGGLSFDLTGNLRVATSSVATGGATPYHLVAANTNNSTALKATAGTIYSIQLGGIGSAPAYLKFYDKASAPTCQTDPVVSQFIIPAATTAANGGGSNVSIPVGKSFSSGIGFCIVTGIADNDNTAVAAATFIINIDYK